MVKGIVSESLSIFEFPKLGVPYFGVLIIRILLFRVLYQGPIFSETPVFSSGFRALGAYNARTR